jgi:P27 family predicted phage terminase small subunit
MRGRKPKPTFLRVIGGNAGHRAINQREPTPRIAAPTPPAILNDDARNEWRRVASQLTKMGVLAVIDRSALAAYCSAFGDWIAATRAINRLAERGDPFGGLLSKTTNGNVIQNPLVGIANKARADMVRFAAEFGMTPSGRSRVQADPFAAQKAADPARKFF